MPAREFYENFMLKASGLDGAGDGEGKEHA
jgi:hypothetical protein